MNTPNNLKYTPSHEWIRVEENEAFVGITDYAQSQLGDIVYVDIDCEGETFDQGEEIGSIEAVKTVADINIPISGKVIAVNTNLQDAADTINRDPYGEGWLIKIAIINPKELDGLLDAEGYKNLLH